MERITTTKHSFIAWMDYDKEEKTLYIVLKKDGSRYKYRNVKVKDVEAIKNSPNRGNYISTVFLKTHQHVAKDLVPLAIVERSLNRGLQNWLSR